MVQREVVLADIRQQMAAGAQHITFGDPDFFNGPGHALAIVEALHAEFPAVTYDVTIKIEHLLKHRDALPVLARTGCLFITSAVESLDDRSAGAAGERAYAGGFRGSAGADAGTRIDHGADVRLFHALDDAGRLSAILLRAIRDLDLIGNVAPDPTGDPAVDSGGFETAGIGRFARARRSMRRRSRVDGSIRIRRWTGFAPICRNWSAGGDGVARGEIFAAIWERAFGELAGFSTAGPGGRFRI